MKQIQSDDMAIARALIKKLIYFDIFSYPLSSREVISYCSYPNLDIENGRRMLKYLTINNLIKFERGFYFLGTGLSKIKKRLEENRRARSRLKAAHKYATLISNFPYVRAVFISGSLSKNVMKPDSDIDFFIITEPGRLWVCRLFLSFFKIVFLGNSYRNFCINYFIDTNSLEIPDKNIYTATEIAFLLPMYNYPIYKEFMLANHWYKAEFPNFVELHEKVRIKSGRIGKFVEILLNNKIGDWLDRKSYDMITGFWRKKFKALDQDSFLLNFRSLKNVSKHHPNNYQQVVLKQFTEGVIAFEESTGFSLSGTPIAKVPA